MLPWTLVMMHIHAVAHHHMLICSTRRVHLVDARRWDQLQTLQVEPAGVEQDISGISFNGRVRTNPTVLRQYSKILLVAVTASGAGSW